jgi:hypothetical protein
MGRTGRGRHRSFARGAISAAFAFAIIAQGLTAPPENQRAEAQALPDGVRSVDPASRPFELPDPVPPPTDEDRRPVLDLSDLEGIWPEDVVEVVPGVRNPGSPDEALAGTDAILDRGAADTDIYSGTGTSSSHVAIVHTDDVNRLDAGKWRDIKLDLDQIDGGWSWTDPKGAMTSFPATLSAASPVVVTTSTGEFSLAPASGQSAGTADGRLVTYPGAFGSGEVQYAPTLGGVQERIAVPPSRRPMTTMPTWPS